MSEQEKTPNEVERSSNEQAEAASDKRLESLEKQAKLRILEKKITENLESNLRKASLLNPHANLKNVEQAWYIGMLAELHYKVDDIGRQAGELLLGLMTAVEDLKLKVHNLEVFQQRIEEMYKGK